jgi:hypothetical protein
MIICPCILLRVEMFQKKFVEKIKTHFAINQLIPPPENHDVYGITPTNTVESDRPHWTIYYDAENIRFACRITKARRETHAHKI